jgi:hypothetical protein
MSLELQILRKEVYFQDPSSPSNSGVLYSQSDISWPTLLKAWITEESNRVKPRSILRYRIEPPWLVVEWMLLSHSPEEVLSP